jgi:hypothetical protein
MKKRTLYLALLVMAALHQDSWYWRDSSLVFGFLPVGLVYHAAYTLAAALLMWLLAKHAWPAHLEEEVSSALSSRRDQSGN